MLLANEERGGTHYLPYVHEPEFLYVVATQLMPRHFLRCFFNTLGNSEWLPLVFKKRSITSDIITTVKRVHWQPMFYLMKTILNRTKRKHQYLPCPSSPSVLSVVVSRESHSAQKTEEEEDLTSPLFPFFRKSVQLTFFRPIEHNGFPPPPNKTSSTTFGTNYEHFYERKRGGVIPRSLARHRFSLPERKKRGKGRNWRGPLVSFR